MDAFMTPVNWGTRLNDYIRFEKSLLRKYVQNGISTLETCRRRTQSQPEKDVIELSLCIE